jgi:hypothetical protein
MRSPFLFALCLLTALTVATQQPATAQTNLLLNGGFERGSEGWSFLASGAVATGSVDNTQSHEGRCSFKLTNQSAFAPNVYARVVQVVTGLRAYTTYKVSCWAKGKAAGITWIGGGPGWFKRVPFPKGDFDWQEVSFEIDAGPAPDNYELMVLTESSTQALWVDDIRFEPVRVDQAKHDAVYIEVENQRHALKQRLAEVENQLRSTKQTNSPYLRLGTAIAERFLDPEKCKTCALQPSLSWTRLQLQEVSQVLDETEQLERARSASPNSPPAGPATSRSVLRSNKVRLRDGIFYNGGQPYFFDGYGHFGSVIRDLPDFPAIGVSLVQDGSAGPSSMNADGSLSANATNVLLGLDRAARSGVRVDFLLSPHYYPAWAEAPDLHNGNIGFLNFNIFHPKAKAAIGKWAEVMAERLKDKPALHSVCLANEPVYNSSGRDPYTRPEFTRYLREKHRDIAVLNALYGTSYARFEDVPVPPGAMPQKTEAQRAYYDWTCFNKQMFAGWHAWLDSTLKHNGLKAPTHTKIMVFQSLDRDKVGWGVDPELMCQATDIAGCDDYAFFGGAYAYDWLQNEFFYDLLHSFRGQSVFNSENHVIPDNSPPSHIPMNHARAVLWQGGLHHQGSTTIWVWEQAADPSLAGSIYFRPANIYGAGRAMLDLNRLGAEVAAINTARPRVVLLYSQPSIFWESKYQPTIYSLYTALNFLGQNITFISERQLAQGKAAKVDWLLVPNASHVLATTPAALARFVRSGGKILLAGKDSLRWDEYHRPLPQADWHCQSIELKGSDEASAAVLRQALNSLDFADLRDTATLKPAWGVEFRVVRHGNTTLVPLINFNKETKTLQLSAWAKHRAVDLLTGQPVDLNVIRAEPMLPRLLQINAARGL